MIGGWMACSTQANAMAAPAICNYSPWFVRQICGPLQCAVRTGPDKGDDRESGGVEGELVAQLRG